MRKRREVMDRLVAAWDENPGELEQVASSRVPEATRDEVKEVSRVVGRPSGRESMRERFLRRGIGSIPFGQRRVIRTPIREE